MTVFICFVLLASTGMLSISAREVTSFCIIVVKVSVVIVRC